MENKMRQLIVWNKAKDRPATRQEIKQLEDDKDLVINYYTRSNPGLVWIDLSDKAEAFFELRDAQIAEKYNQEHSEAQ